MMRISSFSRQIYRIGFLLILGTTCIYSQTASDTTKKSGQRRGKRTQSTGPNFKVEKKDAGSYFSNENYVAALLAYQMLYTDNPSDVAVNNRLGLCYLLTNLGKAKAVPYFEFVVKQKDAPKDAYLNLGKAYSYANKFDEAIDAYKTYKESPSLKPEFTGEVTRLIEMAENGKKLIAAPIKVAFENMGKQINSNGADYNPIINADETVLYFTSMRQGNIGAGTDIPTDIGIYTADVYYAQVREGVWQKAKNIGPIINTEFDEEVVGTNPTGDKMILYFNEFDAASDLFYSFQTGKTWSKPEPMGPSINTKGNETGGTLSKDGKILIFASDRKGGLGGKDLYKSNRLPNGDWSTPVSLGPKINSPYDEDAPFLFYDNKTLYFSSKGFDSMGGYDIFWSVYDETTDTWSDPVNMGYPLNTSDDDEFFSLAANRKHGYIAATREDGFGDQDIYRVVFEGEAGKDIRYTYIRCTISTPSDSVQYPRSKVVVTNEENKIIGSYTPEGTSNKFLMILGAGKYHLNMTTDGLKPYTEDFEIPEKAQPAELTKTIALTKP